MALWKRQTFLGILKDNEVSLVSVSYLYYLYLIGQVLQESKVMVFILLEMKDSYLKAMSVVSVKRKQ